MKKQHPHSSAILRFFRNNGVGLVPEPFGRVKYAIGHEMQRTARGFAANDILPATQIMVGNSYAFCTIGSAADPLVFFDVFDREKRVGHPISTTRVEKQQLVFTGSSGSFRITLPVSDPTRYLGLLVHIVRRPTLAEAIRANEARSLKPSNQDPEGADDLTRIRGVGALIQKRLQSMGITRYEQIARWSDDDIAKTEELLRFDGRIQQENWKEQARILAAGGCTAFSRRCDRSDEMERELYYPRT